MHLHRLFWLPLTLASLACSSVSVLSGPLVDPGSPGVLTTLIRGLEHRESIYESLEAVCTYETFISARQLEAEVVPGAKLGPRSFDLLRFLWSGGRWRLEVLELFSRGANDWCFLGPLPIGKNLDDLGACPVRAVETCDGEMLCQLDFSNLSAIVRTQAGRKVGGSFQRLAHHLLLQVNAKCPSEFLQTLDNATVEAIDEIGGIQCYRVVGYKPGVDEAGGYMAALWVAPERGFAPVKFEDLMIQGNTRNGQRYVTVCTDMQEVRSGLWLPTRITHHVYGYYGDDPDVWRWTNVVTVKSWEVDPPLEANRFAIDLPLGATIMETRGEELLRRVVGEPQEVLKGFQIDAEPPPIDPRRAQPLKSSDLRENAWP